MSNYIVFNSDQEILRTGGCPAFLVAAQAIDGAFAMEGVANDAAEKIEFDGFDSNGQPINPHVVDKTPAEITRDNPPRPVIPDEDKPARITKKELAAFMKRVEDLEAR